VTGAREDAEEVVLIDESGAERRFLLHDALDDEGSTYYLVEAADDPEQVLVLRESEGRLESVAGTELERVLALLEVGEPSGG
jgi:hypothetical protein